MFNQYYNGTIRKIVSAFGSLFNEIKIKDTKDGQSVITTVPLTYAPKEKFIKRLTLPSSISSNTRVEITLPKLSFEIAGIMPDPVRRLNKLNIRNEFTAENSSTMFMETPYNIMFTLNSYTRTIDNNLQIMEQILPYFNPEFIVSMNMNDLHKVVDIPIILNDVGMNEIYEGDFSTRRYITSTYKFTVKAYIYGPLKTDNGSTIKDIDVNFIEEE